jgi:hypothetical protein
MCALVETLHATFLHFFWTDLMISSDLERSFKIQKLYIALNVASKKQGITLPILYYKIYLSDALSIPLGIKVNR